ncbi:MAG: AAA family ATPase [Barrevirus sp.]|uniref:AAA family ATPase n=1 Tax=Barrevirus sp. TaxID=2487763 RepID=A0A3G4ZRD4_9VIRU|nr:MAG: AAA family ATPase [Barrevirus sp.]
MGNPEDEEKEDREEKIKDLFEELDDSLLDLTVLEAETKETIKLVDRLLNRLKEILDVDKETLNEVKKEVKQVIPIDNNDKKIGNLTELLAFAKKYGTEQELIQQNINTKILFDLVKPLEKMEKIVGMDSVKDQILDLILTSLQNLYDNGMLYHTVIMGPPGVGKTMLSKILGEIYLALRILQKERKEDDHNDDGRVGGREGDEEDNKGEYVFKVARRSDLIGKYLGHTAIKTQELIDSCENGVLFIDEVYSLGNEDKRDSFSKECIDTINLNLLEKNFICIVAGYPEEIENCFFSVNPGLKRRFAFTYHIPNYGFEELLNIFLRKLEELNWSINKENKDENKDKLLQFFKDNTKTFEYFGGDIDTLITYCKTCHSRRIFMENDNELIRKVMDINDIVCGFDKLVKSKNNGKDKESKDENYKRMFS